MMSEETRHRIGSAKKRLAVARTNLGAARREVTDAINAVHHCEEDLTYYLNRVAPCPVKDCGGQPLGPCPGLLGEQIHTVRAIASHRLLEADKFWRPEPPESQYE